MSWSYAGAPGVSDKDTVRFLIGDTDTTDQLLADEEIQFLIDQWLEVQGTAFYVASIACETIAARLAREVSYSADGVSISLSELQAKFVAQAATLRAQHKELLVGGSPDVGGVGVDEEQDPQIAPFIFGTQMHDNFNAGRQEYGSRFLYGYIAETSPGA